jgi:hypothetical protein
MPTQQTQTQTFEQLAAMWTDLAGWSAAFGSGVVDAFERGGTSAVERWTAVRAQRREIGVRFQLSWCDFTELRTPILLWLVYPDSPFPATRTM